MGGEICHGCSKFKDSGLKLAITGASGFIGKHLLKELLLDNVELSIVGRNFNDPLFANKNIKLIKLDISNPPKNTFELMGRPDVLIHLAWGGLPKYLSLHHFELELPAQYRFLKGLVQAGLKNLLVTGTCFEYGMQSGELEEGMLEKPINPYGSAKNTLLKQLTYLQSELPFSLVWARLFYMYGAGQSEHSLMSQLANSVSRGEKVFRMSGGEQLRDFLPVEDVVEKLIFLAKARMNIGVVNICSGIPISVRGFVESQIKKNGWAIDLDLGFHPYANYEPMAFWGSSRKFRNLIEQINGY